MILLLRLLAFVIVGLIAYVSYKMNNQLYIIFALGGVLAGAMFMASYMLQVKNVLKMYKRDNEKKSIDSTENQSKIDVLESKIEVLEKALKTALENK